MKTLTPLGKWLTRSSLILTAAGLVWLPVHAFGQEKGASKLLDLKPAQTAAQTASISSGIEPMKCAKCTDTWVPVKEVSTKGSRPATTWRQHHGCRDCQTSIVASGHGKAKVSKAVHQCAHCGGPKAACCNSSSEHSH